jgi:murein L,D-transpeptidase YafK
MMNKSPAKLLRAGRALAMAAALTSAAVLSGCAQTEIPPHLRPLSKDAMMLLGKKGMDTGQPIFIRIFKEESELEVWKQRADGRFYHFKTYPICSWSGDLGPKLKQGDKQAPEGFYQVARGQMNPNSQFHLAFNLGFPNAYDKSHKRTGDFLMVHGKCKSAGCYAMTDALMEEIYALSREAYIGGQESIHVHAFPFRMTDANMTRHAKNEWAPFWKTLKQGYDHFEFARQTPSVAVCQRSYVVNVKLPANMTRIDAEGPCPRFEKPVVEAFKPNPNEKFAEERVLVPGPKQQRVADTPSTWSTRSGLIGATQQ